MEYTFQIKECEILEENNDENSLIEIFTISMSHDNFNKELIKGKEDDLSTAIIKEIESLESFKKLKNLECCKNLQINGNVKFGSIEFIATASGFVYFLKNYKEIRGGLTLLMHDIGVNPSQIVNACCVVLGLKPIKKPNTPNTPNTGKTQGM